MHSARAPGDEHGSGLRARRAHAGNLTPQAAAGSERGGARSATGPRCPQAPPRGWRRGGRGWWRVLKRRVAPAEDRSTRRAGLRPQPGGRARGGGRGGACGGGLGAGRAREPREGGAAAQGGLWRPRCHTRGGSGGGGSGSGRRRWDGHGRAARAGAGCLPPRSLARSPSRLLAGCEAGLSPSALGKEGGGQRRRQVPAAAADPGPGGGCGSDGAGERFAAERTARAAQAGGVPAFHSPRGLWPGSHETRP